MSGARTPQAASFEFGAERVAAVAGAVMALFWLLEPVAPTPLALTFGPDASTSMYVYAALQIALMFFLVRRNRVAWVFAVALSGSLLVPAGVLFGLSIRGDPFEAIIILAPYLTMFVTQLACVSRMQVGGDPRLMAAGAGFATALLWLVAGLTEGSWTAASLAAFGGKDIGMAALVVLVALEAGLAAGILLRNRAAWAFALSLAATLTLPLLIAVTRMQWRGQFVDATTALFLHVALIAVQAMAYDRMGAAGAVREREA